MNQQLPSRATHGVTAKTFFGSPVLRNLGRSALADPIFRGGTPFLRLRSRENAPKNRRNHASRIILCRRRATMTVVTMVTVSQGGRGRGAIRGSYPRNSPL